jgi:hypothetical protein
MTSHRRGGSTSSRRCDVSPVFELQSVVASICEMENFFHELAILRFLHPVGLSLGITLQCVENKKKVMAYRTFGIRSRRTG